MVEFSYRNSNLEYFKNIFDSLCIAVIIHDDSDLRIVDVNKTACDMYGYGIEEFKTMDLGTLSSEEEIYVRQEAVSRYIKVLTDGPQKFEWRARKKDGIVFWTEVNVAALEISGTTFIMANIRDTSSCKKIMETLCESERRLRTLLNAMPDIVCFKDGHGRWLEANAYDLKLFQLDGVDYRGKKDSELAKYSEFYHDAFIKCEETDEKTWTEGVVCRNDEIIPAPDGTEQIFDVIKIPAFSESGERQGLLVVGRNITERRAAENALMTAFNEKEALLCELYHRTKNNMQVILAMLALRAHRSDNAEIKTVFKDMIHKINVMSLAHEKLYQSKDLSNIKLKEYIAEVVHLIVSSADAPELNISIREKFDDIKVLIDVASPCGLIICELLTNSLKHAFFYGLIGTIDIVISKNIDDSIEIRYSDDGPGLSENFDIKKIKGTGLRTIADMVEYQLRGKIEFNGSGNFACTIKFPGNTYRPRV